ncbi:MAG: hypothetical protein HZC02_01855 [Candidatus Levybacteria bacterium]|nr:hypothetical protein [Candidatus Levybacteria bacterium]
MAGITTTPITREEALQYDAEALRANCEKRKNNIKIFEEAIAKEQESIKQDEYMISAIDPNHPDVQTLKGNIEKIKLNIKTFQDAITEENSQIDRNNQMITMIEAN